MDNSYIEVPVSVLCAIFFFFGLSLRALIRGAME